VERLKINPIIPMASSSQSSEFSSALAHSSESHVVHTTHVLLKYVFAIVPVVAGADKFTNILAHWEAYLSPFVLRIIPVSGSTFMHVVGVVEIVAGMLVWLKPRIGGFVVMAWLLAIAGQLLLGWQSVDVAVRDIVIALTGALTLARLTPIAAKTT
jgi:hypothetical protein